MGKNVHVEFGSTEDEVVVFSDFASKATVWCLKSGRAVEIRDPKFPGVDGKGWGYRPVAEGRERGRPSVMAVLCRNAGYDVMMLLAPRTYAVLKKVELPTVDAAGLKWSRDGRWIAVWDAASSGYHVHIYTADGHLYRSLSRESNEEMDKWGIEGLGVKSIEWVPGNEWLAVGGWDRRVRILSTRTFSPVVFLDHTAEIQVPSAPVYTELLDGRSARTYSLTPQPATPPKPAGEKGDSIMKQGISIVSFNHDGTLCATRDDSTPTTVWIWDLRSLRPRTILIQYSPVKSLLWHPLDPHTLLIHCAHDSPTMYLYTSPDLSSSSSAAASTSFVHGPPEILTFADHLKRPTSAAPITTKWDGRWLFTAVDKKPALVFGHQQGYVLAWPEGKDQILRFEKEDGEESDDSLYDILTGKTPIPRLPDAPDEDLQEGYRIGSFGTETYVDSTVGLDDTFRAKRGIPPGRGESVFGESGLDEMF